MVAFEVRLGGHSGQGAKGNLTLSSSGMRFEGKESDKKVEVKQEDVEGMEWGRIGKSFQLRVSQSDGSVVRSHPPPASRIPAPTPFLHPGVAYPLTLGCISGAGEGKLVVALRRIFGCGSLGWVSEHIGVCGEEGRMGFGREGTSPPPEGWRGGGPVLVGLV